MNKPFAFNGRTWQWLQIGQSWELRTGGSCRCPRRSRCRLPHVHGRARRQAE
jgi:hypothetical protein